MSKILLFGDICPTPDYRPLFDTGNIFSSEIINEIKSADFVVGNLECPATDSTKAIRKAGPNLKAKPEDLDMLTSIGFNAFSLANNHIYDYGAQGFYDTLAALSRNNLEYFGAGRNSADARKELIIDIAGSKIGFLSYAEAEFNLATDETPGANHFDILESFDTIHSLKSRVDYLVVLYHGGIEHYQYPSPLVQKKCRKMVDSGADLVSIQHSHCIGTSEVYHDGTIVYGQGNSVFGLRPKSQLWNSGLILTINSESKSVSFTPIIATKNGVDFAPETTGKNILVEFQQRSRKITDSEWIRQSWIDCCLASKPLTLPQLYGRSKWFNRFNRLFNNKLVDLLYPYSAKMVTMNLLRCEAHHEVMTTILEQEVLKK